MYDYEEAFYKTIQESALLQLVNFNTRSGNMLDLILTNNTNVLSSIDYTNPLEYDKHISDHLSIICNILKAESQSFINNQITSDLHLILIKLISLILNLN